MDFKTSKDLADYLMYLDKNATAYNSYFKWKEHVKFHSFALPLSMVCHMCIKLHLESHFGIESKLIQNIDEKWNRNLNCKRPFPNQFEFFNMKNL